MRQSSFALVGVSHGECGDRFVEFVTVADIGRYRRRIARAGMGTRKGAAAQCGVKRQSRFKPGSDIGEAVILEPPDVEISAVHRNLGPAEEDVGGRLQHALADDNALAVIGIVGSPSVRGQHRLLRFLDLEQQRRLVARHQQADGAERADAADPDDFECDIMQTVALQQNPPVFLQCLGVRSEGLARMQIMPAQMVHQRRLFLDPPSPSMLFDQAEMRFAALQNRRPAASPGCGGSWLS